MQRDPVFGEAAQTLAEMMRADFFTGVLNEYNSGDAIDDTSGRYTIGYYDGYNGLIKMDVHPMYLMGHADGEGDARKDTDNN